MNFNELNLSKEMIRATDEMGFTEPTSIQSQTIPLILEGADVIGQSQTGTGKTAAFAIPVLEKVDVELKKPQVLILCPTRELAVQISNEFKKLSKYMKGIKSFPIYGGEPINRQIMGLRKGPQIIVGTPGRTMDHMRRRTLKFNNLTTVILDEADEMLKMGFREDIETILEHVPDEKQMILFSATMPKTILNITHKFQNDPQLVKVTSKALTTLNVSQRYYEVKDKYKIDALCRLLDVYNPKLSLIFCNTKKKVDEITDLLLSKGIACDKIHGDINQTVRLNVLNKFNNKKINILVATDVAARGLDINNVEAVFNFDVPENEDYYVHRIGRTGRANKTGRAFTLVSRREQRLLRDIKHYIKTDIPKKQIPTLSKVNSVKIDGFMESIKDTIDNSDLDKYIDIINTARAEGYSTKSIAAALLKSELELHDGKDINFNYDKYERLPAGNGRDRNRNRKPRRGAKREGMTRFYINAGKNHKISAKDILGAIAGETNIPGREIGTIDLFEKFSFVELPEEYVKNVLDIMNKSKIRGKKIKMEVANKK